MAGATAGSGGRCVAFAFAAEFREGVRGGPLLSLLFVAAPGWRIAAAADLSRDVEALAVVGALLGEHLVGGREAEIPLGPLLE